MLFHFNGISSAALLSRPRLRAEVTLTLATNSPLCHAPQAQFGIGFILKRSDWIKLQPPDDSVLYSAAFKCDLFPAEGIDFTSVGMPQNIRHLRV